MEAFAPVAVVGLALIIMVVFVLTCFAAMKDGDPEPEESE